jgi:glycosyltransferase involved in cell wall biosynthesis
MEQNEMPLVSVLMTAYNRENFIPAAIESVLSSSYTNWELVITDDGSKDATVRIANEYAQKDSRIKVYINENNLGDYPNRNRAASYAHGKYLKYLDSDDMLYRHGLEVFVRFMEEDPTAAMGICYRKNITHRPFPWVMPPEESLRHHFFTEGFLDCGPTGTIIRRDAFEAVGGFSGKRMIGDLEFGLKVAGRYPVMLVPPALVFWRSHGDQEFFTGINGNMYATMTGTMLKEQFDGLSDNVFTKEEQGKVLRRLSRSNRLESWKKAIKHMLSR